MRTHLSKKQVGVMGGLAGLLSGMFFGVALQGASGKTIPGQLEVQEGFVAPYFIRPDVADIDGDGQDETTFLIRENRDGLLCTARYGLMRNSHGESIWVPYTVTAGRNYSIREERSE